MTTSAEFPTRSSLGQVPSIRSCDPRSIYRAKSWSTHYQWPSFSYRLSSLSTPVGASKLGLNLSYLILALRVSLVSDSEVVKGSVA